MDQQKRTIFLVHNTARENAARMCHQAPGDWVAVFKPKTRSLEQNAKLHAMLTDISDQAIYMGKKRSGICENIENKSWFSLLYNRDCDKFKRSNEGDKRRAWLNQNSEDRNEAIERGSGKT